MAESLYIPKNGSKADIYEAILPQISAFAAFETDRVASLANISAILKEAFGFFWVGFYVVKNGELVLCAFQGTLACGRIKYGRGVCGAAWRDKITLVVEDVDAFPGHIACSSASRSEIVVPIFKNKEVVAVLDVDSDRLAEFDDIDKNYLEQITKIMSDYVF